MNLDISFNNLRFHDFYLLKVHFTLQFASSLSEKLLLYNQFLSSTCIFIFLFACSLFFAPLSNAITPSPNIPLILSGFSKDENKGIYKILFDSKNNSFSLPELLVEQNNPTYGLKHNQHWYFTSTEEVGKLHSYFQTNDAHFSLHNHLPTFGKGPCHLSIDKEGKFIALSNYGSGNLVVYSIAPNGELFGLPQIKHNTGQGFHSKRQTSPHAHWSGWTTLKDSSKGLYLIDLGLDKIFWYPLNTQGKLGDGMVAFTAHPGDGPRHMAFHPFKPWIYIVNELSNTLTFTIQAENGALNENQKISTLPEDFKGQNLAAHIVISKDGKHIYTSNRGDNNSLSVFDILDNGQVTLVQTISTKGQFPRFFLILESERKILVANQNSNSIAVLNILPSGKLSFANLNKSIQHPTFIAPMSVD